MYKYIKNDGYYWAIKDGDAVTRIDVHINPFDHTKYYTIKDKQFNTLHDAKAYVKENY